MNEISMAPFVIKLKTDTDPGKPNQKALLTWATYLPQKSRK